ncbi:hypothetical protein WJX77_011898 [Trebouxia sp. C0004]
MLSYHSYLLQHQAQHEDLSPEQTEQWRRVLGDKVLGTDMKKQFSILTTFLAATKCPLSSSNVELHRTGSAGTAWLDIKPENRVPACQMMLKCAEIGHWAADCKTHKRWAYQLEELIQQVGFFNIVGLPLFKAMADVFEDSAPLYEGANFQAWEAAAAKDALQRTGSAAGSQG